MTSNWKSISFLDLTYYLFMASIPLEVVGTKYFNFTFSLSVPTGLLFVFAYFFLNKSSISLFCPRLFILPMFWIFIGFTHFFWSEDFQFFRVLTGIASNILISIIIYNYSIQSKNILNGLLVMGLATGISSLLIVTVLGSDLFTESRLRLFGFDENNTGSILALGSLILIISARELNFRFYTIVTYVLLSIMSLAVVVATGSRGAMLAFVAGLIFYFAIYRFKRLFSIKTILLTLVIIGFSISFFQQSEITQLRWQSTFEGDAETRLSNRDIIYSLALRQIIEKPIFGWGLREAFFDLGKSTRGWGDVGTHNTYLMILVTAGFIGALPFFIFFAYPFFKYRYYADNDVFKFVFVLFFFVLFVFLSLDWLNRKQIWILYSMLLASMTLSRIPIVPRSHR